MAHSADVLIVGAGPSGLYAARQIKATGHSVAVIEARDRVGGRTHSYTHNGYRLDIGGQWISPKQRRVNALADEFGMARFATYDQGKKVLEVNGKIGTYSGQIPAMSWWHLLELQTVIWRINRLANRVDPTQPWNDESAAWDRDSVASYAHRTIRSKAVYGMIEAMVRSILSAEPEDVSFLYFLNYLRNAGGIEPLIETQGGAQNFRFTDGAQTLSERLAAAVGNVHLSSPALSIRHSGADVEIDTPNGTFTGRRVVIAVPPVICSRIQFDPLLPARREQITQRMPMGYTLKCLAFYDKPFWRSAGFSGESVSNSGPLSFTFDNSTEDGEVSCLVAFVNGRRAREIEQLSADERRDVVLQRLAKYFGNEALKPTSYAEHNWNAERWSAGCPVGAATPGSFYGYGAAIRAPVGSIFWASTEAATEWCGFIEGALESGERAAREVIDSLK